ncbi:endonuclease/exonuclease/phosphatase family protein [Sphingobacterium sp. lm-10]|uniref:endonuclease/exonuclease/phosphatase family protein n=1 Tax=Sphingobacterium sp. lm-10 TaxID=2944904 RepID=UPI002021BC6E|nr:endonuclease/exonuclease/phosphatase family protein [Sphingobacterium sp. lm-10]MCL7987834.1 endonuclease/exonuclease/phosphatase family protein [Sphingobacterium sp. lm-10]
MNQINQFLILCLLLSTASAALHAKQKAMNTTGKQLKIMSYNIHHASPPSTPDKIDIEAIIAVIRNEDPDLVALQEVDVRTKRSGHIDQAKQIAKALSMHYYFAKAIDFDGGEYGQAILSKRPFNNPQIHHLPSIASSNAEPRILATVDIDLGNQQLITFATTHLDAQRDPQNRTLQAKELVRIARDSKHPMVIAGDLNMTTDQEAFALFEKVLKPTCTTCGFTIPVITPKKTIDFILLRNQDSWEVVSHHVVQEHYASDHLPVTALLRWVL